MIYTLIISLVIEKPFYLLQLRPQSFSFQIVSGFRDIFVKFSNFMSQGRGFDSLFCPEESVFLHSECSRGRVLAPFESSPWDFSLGVMVLDEIDTCIRSL